MDLIFSRVLPHNEIAWITSSRVRSKIESHRERFIFVMNRYQFSYAAVSVHELRSISWFRRQVFSQILFLRYHSARSRSYPRSPITPKWCSTRCERNKCIYRYRLAKVYDQKTCWMNNPLLNPKQLESKFQLLKHHSINLWLFTTSISNATVFCYLLELH